MKSLINITLFSVLIINCLITDVKSEEVTQSCLQCICKASSDCKLNTKCHNTGGNYFCGPYQISWAYWADGGKPGNTGHSDDFEHCLNDRNCAEVAVRGYMTKWKKDCNNDGVIDCLDFAAIHKAGASGCDQQWLYNSQYWNVFRQCQLSSDSTQPSNDEPWVPSQPQPRPQPQPYPTTDPWNAPQPQTPPQRPTLKPQPYPNTPYNPPTSDQWNQPQPQPQPQPAPDEGWDPPQPQPKPTLKPQTQPYPNDAYSQPDIPWDQSPPRPSQPIPDTRPQTYPNPDPYTPPQHRPTLKPQPQPIPNDPWTQPQSRPTLKPQPNPNDPWNQPQPVSDDTYPVSQPQPTANDPWPQPAAQPTGTETQPYADDPYNSQPSGPQAQPYPDDAYYQPQPQPSADDPWDAVSRAVDEIARPTPKPQPRPQPAPRDPWNANQPQSQPLVIPGRAPTQPISWAQPSNPNPLNNFEQPFRPILEPNRQPSSGLVEVVTTPNNGTVEDNCLECICQASSDCDLNKHCEGAYCGPYLISWAYWSDGGQPGGDYVTCANDKGCAEQAVQGYMNKWQKDCNSDGIIDCSDFAAIHKLGPHSCSSEEIHGTDYWTSYQSCKTPAIDTRRLQPNPSSGSLTGRSVAQSIPAVNTFHEYPNPNPVASNPTPVERSTNPVVRDAPNYFARDSRVVFPNDEPNHSQPNPYEVTSNPNRPNNTTNDKLFEEIGLQRECLDCICHASSRCNPDIGCQNDGTGGYVCGPYQTNWAYWSDGGKPGIRGNDENLENYQSCLNNKHCAEAAVYGYLGKWKRDCNEDQQINCYDFAALHMGGPSNCNAQWFLESQYWSDFRECFDFRRKK